MSPLESGLLASRLPGSVTHSPSVALTDAFRLLEPQFPHPSVTQADISFACLAGLLGDSEEMKDRKASQRG